jgi:hypothetical protein
MEQPQWCGVRVIAAGARQAARNLGKRARENSGNGDQSIEIRRRYPIYGNIIPGFDH